MMLDTEQADVLVVDDTPANLKLLTSLLGEQGHRVRPSSSVALARRSIAARLPDLILLDVRMPECDGYTLCRQLKADPLTRAIPVMFISALNEATDKLQGFDAGGVDYVTKPFEPAEVAARVRTHIEIQRLRRRLERAQAELERKVEERTAELAWTAMALEQSDERLRRVIEATSDGIWDWNPSTNEVFFSDRWYTMLDYAPGEFAASYASWRERVHPEDLPAAETALHAHLEGRLPRFNIEVRMRTGRGEWKWIQSRGRIVERDGDDRATRMVGSHADITERKLSEARIAAALREKEALLKEIYHRVKNNLQVVASLLNMQAQRASDEHVRAPFEASVARVMSMALVHEQLYRSADLASVDFAEYLKQLAGRIESQHAHGPHDRVMIVSRLEPCTLGVETAIPCGLIVNELLSNAYEHAFAGRTTGTIEVALRLTPGGGIELAVSDDGRGFPEQFEPERTDSLGWRLMLGLAAQLGGELGIASRRPARVELRVPRLQHQTRQGFDVPEVAPEGPPAAALEPREDGPPDPRQC